jgi:hypothetical protein
MIRFLKVKEANQEIERLEAILSEHNIDPKSGQTVTNSDVKPKSDVVSATEVRKGFKITKI